LRIRSWTRQGKNTKKSTKVLRYST
jgi:hypothetical protein